jgi:hypothetical protein
VAAAAEVPAPQQPRDDDRGIALVPAVSDAGGELEEDDF